MPHGQRRKKRCGWDCTLVFAMFRFARTGRSQDNDVLARGDPVALSQLQDSASFQATRGRQVEFFEAGRQWEGSCMKVASNTVLASLGAFMVHEQRQSFFKGQFGELGIGLLFLQGLAECGNA